MMNTPNALLKLLVWELKNKREDIIPEGYFTMQQIADESGLSINGVKTKVYEAVKNGTMERKMFYKLTACGHSHKAPFYKLLSK